jgi:hypothetical protein
MLGAGCGSRIASQTESQLVEEHVPRTLREVRKFLFCKVKHPVPADFWVLGVTRTGATTQTVDAIVSIEHAGIMVKDAIEQRESWLRLQGRDLD